MTDIFISHAVADEALVDQFVAFLKEAIGVPARSIFCSSVDGQGIPLGNDFNAYMKEQIQSPKLVILLMTPCYMDSWFCLMELGATWAASLKALPIVVPPIKFDVVSNTLGLKQGWSIDNDAKLIDLRQMIKTTNIVLEDRTDHDWDKKRAAWKANLKTILKNLSSATSVPASEHEKLQNELESVRGELGNLQDAYSEASNTIEELKAAKDSVEVKAIMVKKFNYDPEEEFDRLLEEIASLRPKVGLCFYHNIIMDYYNKSASIDFSDRDQQSDAESAIQYNILEADPPHEFLWGGKRLSKIAAALKALDEFLTSVEASDFVKERERAGHTMDTDDLEFWEENLS